MAAMQLNKRIIPYPSSIILTLPMSATLPTYQSLSPSIPYLVHHINILCHITYHLPSLLICEKSLLSPQVKHLQGCLIHTSVLGIQQQVDCYFLDNLLNNGSNAIEQKNNSISFQYNTNSTHVRYSTNILVTVSFYPLSCTPY